LFVVINSVCFHYAHFGILMFVNSKAKIVNGKICSLHRIFSLSW